MKYLVYTTYCSGRSGLSNGIMSIEIGVILAFLMDRVLILDGNVSPPANIVQYPRILSNQYRSKITDLFDLPIPWMNIEQADLSKLDSKEFASHSLGNSMFYFPPTLNLAQEDARWFAWSRKHFLTYSASAKEISVLTMPGGPGVGPHQYKMANLTFYSYFFYLDTSTKEHVFDLLTKMTPQQPYREFAAKVSKDLGAFNAVHIRRGDFKVTYGVSTLERTPQEVLEVLEHHFRRDEPLVILTDEMSDPFFTDIRRGYPKSLFLDQFILDNYRKEFLDLPCHDSLALAFLGQLIAAASQDFIGSMTSTYTALIQRYRGNSGKVEPFKFLWNELPDRDMNLERGRHPRSTCVPIKHGVMIEEASGPYSWNRYNPRIDPAWMREWPEGFLTGVTHTRSTQSAEASPCVDRALACSPTMEP